MAVVALTTKGIFQTFHLVPLPNSAPTLDMDQSLLSTVPNCCDARSVHHSCQVPKRENRERLVTPTHEYH